MDPGEVWALVVLCVLAPFVGTIISGYLFFHSFNPQSRPTIIFFWLTVLVQIVASGAIMLAILTLTA
jgi:thiamine transporter ThiT